MLRPLKNLALRILQQVRTLECLETKVVKVIITLIVNPSINFLSVQIHNSFEILADIPEVSAGVIERLMTKILDYLCKVLIRILLVITYG